MEDKRLVVILVVLVMAILIAGFSIWSSLHRPKSYHPKVEGQLPPSNIPIQAVEGELEKMNR
ncbi:MAG TPA: hypothetical protein EYP85_14515 [Armatimonadetes bacterium]|nr:hypothetical protein [Armatimonadota bacterium]